MHGSQFETILIPSFMICFQAVVDFMLDNFDHENACFLAERVHAEGKAVNFAKFY